MAYHDPSPGTLKRKRRRRPDKYIVDARLILDETLGGSAVRIPQSLLEQLFASTALAVEDVSSTHSYVAISLRGTSDPAQHHTSSWTIQACLASSQQSGNSREPFIRVPLASRALKHISQALKLTAQPHQRPSGAPIDVRLSAVTPIPLTTVYVHVDHEALKRYEETQKQYAGGFQAKSSNRNHKSRSRERRGDLSRTKSQESTTSAINLVECVRKGLSDFDLVHVGDVIPLPLSPHPITHAPAPTVAVSACEPVFQGRIHSETRIILLPHHVHQDQNAGNTAYARLPASHVPPAVAEIDEDTSNEAFYTAAEDGGLSSVPTTPQKKRDTSTDPESESEASSTDVDLSDDPEEMISLSAPTLGSQTPGLMSARTMATPRPFGQQMNGIHTPGSVYSTMTSATVRGGSAQRSKVLRAQSLLSRIPDNLLHPHPRPAEDEEARVYVDTSSLSKLGCFSGDWVEIEMAEDPTLNGLASLAMFKVKGDDDSATKARVVKVYSLPESLSTKPARYPMRKRFGRRDSLSSAQGIIQPASTVQLSPILWANMAEPDFIRITSLVNNESLQQFGGRATKAKVARSAMPPLAREVKLVKISTPLSTERSLDPSLFKSLQDHFEQRQRILKAGDLIAIPIDESLSRAIFESGAPDGDVVNNELLSALRASTATQQKTAVARASVGWFQVGEVDTGSDRDEDANDPMWCGVAYIDPSKTVMRQSDSAQRRLPAALGNPWMLYEGVRRALPSASTSSAGSTPSSQLSFTPEIRRRLRQLMAAATSPRATYLGLPPLAILLSSSQRNTGKAYTAASACQDLGMHVFPIDAYGILSQAVGGGADVNSGGLLKARAERALQCGAGHTAVVIRHIDALTSERMFVTMQEILAESRVLIATTTSIDKVPDNLRGLFTHELEMSAPDEAEREGILQSVLADRSVAISPAVDLAAVAVKTAALVAGDLADVVDRAIAAKTDRLEKLAETLSESASQVISLYDIELAGGEATTCLLAEDFDLAVDEARKNFADAIGAPKIPNVQWSDVGGLANVKDAVIETIQLPLARPELFAKGLKKRSGILFYGPPGTGKTLLAKAIATEFSLNFFSVKGPELLNMYIGESEANVRRVFQRARDARPCVVFFDELDSVAPKRGNQGDSGGVMDRIVSQLLAELDGMSDGDSDGGGGGGVFVIGATNRPDLLDQALLRPGRFDKMLYLGVSDTHEKQLKILQALTRKFALDPALDLSQVAESLPFTYTGADLYALCSDAMLKAITRSARLVDERVAAINAGHAAARPAKPAITIAQFFDYHATDSDTQVLVTQEDFVAAQRELVPSVSAEELGHYTRVKAEFEGGKDKAQSQGQQGQQGQQQKSQNQTSRGGQGQMVTSSQQLEQLQQKMIEDMISRGLQDGSIAKGGKGRKGIEGNGGARGPVRTSSQSNGTSARRDDDEDDDDDLVVRTDHLAINGKGKGKGKGKATAGDGRMAAAMGQFGDDAEDDDLYQ